MLICTFLLSRAINRLKSLLNVTSVIIKCHCVLMRVMGKLVISGSNNRSKLTHLWIIIHSMKHRSHLEPVNKHGRVQPAKLKTESLKLCTNVYMRITFLYVFHPPLQLIWSYLSIFFFFSFFLIVLTLSSSQSKIYQVALRKKAGE